MAVDAVRRQCALDQRDGDPGVFDDKNAVLLQFIVFNHQHAVLFLLKVLDQIQDAVQHHGRLIIRGDGDVDTCAHQGDDGINGRLHAQVEQLAGWTVAPHGGDEFKVLRGGLAMRRNEQHSQGFVARR